MQDLPPTVVIILLHPDAGITPGVKYVNLVFHLKLDLLGSTVLGFIAQMNAQHIFLSLA